MDLIELLLKFSRSLKVILLAFLLDFLALFFKLLDLLLRFLLLDLLIPPFVLFKDNFVLIVEVNEMLPKYPPLVLEALIVF